MATTATSPSWEICLQAEEQSAAFLHIWTITDAAGNSWYSNDPDFCQQWAVNPGPITVEHIIIDPVTSLFESCTREVNIYPPVNGKSCPNYNPIVNVESSNGCTLETSIFLNLTDIGIPFTVSFGDGSPAISASASPIVHQYPWGGTQVNQTNGAGIALTNLKNYIVRRNDIIGGSSDIPGIRLSKGGFGVVDCNTIQDKYIGILAEAVPDNRYGVNSLYANFRDMEFKGDNFGTTGSELAWNIFSHSADYSIYFHPGTLIGNQYHTRFNNWFGQTWTNGMPDVDVFAFLPTTGKKFYHPEGEPAGSVHHPKSNLSGLFAETTMPEEPVQPGFCLSDLDGLPLKDELPQARQQWEWVATDSLGADLAPPLRVFLRQRAYRQGAVPSGMDGGKSGTGGVFHRGTTKLYRPERNAAPTLARVDGFGLRKPCPTERSVRPD